MAIYHLSVQAISRGKGQSAVASASYRSGEKLVDEQTGEVKFYQRDVEPDSMILAPEHAPEFVHDRQQLWNEVERVEKNANSRLAREINVALPVELKPDEQKDLIKKYAQEQFVERGMVADIAIHRDEANNPHAHIMLTIRPFEKDGTWQQQKSRKEYILDENGEKALNNKGNPKTRKIDLIGWDKKELVQEWRAQWSEHTNVALEKVGVQEKISHLSHEARGLETLPTKHEGHVVRAMEANGKITEIGDYNRLVKTYNETVVDLNKYRELRQNGLNEQVQQPESPKASFTYSQGDLKSLNQAKEILKGKEPTFDSIDKRLEQIDRWEKGFRNNQSELYKKDPVVKTLSADIKSLQGIQQHLKGKQEALATPPKSLNPFKVKEYKNNLKSEISIAKEKIESIEKRIEPQLQKLNIRTIDELPNVQKVVEKLHKEVYKQNPIEAISYQRDKLNEAKNILAKPYVAELKQHYPNEQVINYLKPEIAKDLVHLNHEAKSIAPIKEFNRIAEHFEAQAEQTKSPQDREMAGFLGNILSGLQEGQKHMEKDNKQKARSPKQKQKENELERG